MVHFWIVGSSSLPIGEGRICCHYRGKHVVGIWCVIDYVTKAVRNFVWCCEGCREECFQPQVPLWSLSPHIRFSSRLSLYLHLHHACPRWNRRLQGKDSEIQHDWRIQSFKALSVVHIFCNHITPQLNHSFVYRCAVCRGLQCVTSKYLPLYGMRTVQNGWSKREKNVILYNWTVFA